MAVVSERVIFLKVTKTPIKILEMSIIIAQSYCYNQTSEVHEKVSGIKMRNEDKEIFPFIKTYVLMMYDCMGFQTIGGIYIALSLSDHI